MSEHKKDHTKRDHNRKYHRGRKKKKKGSIVSTIILIIAVIVFVVSAFQLYRIAKGYLDGRSEYKKIKELAIEGGDKGDDKEDSQFKVNFDELLKMNPDTIGWIRFSPEPSIISYPIVQGKDNDEYLHKTFTDNENTLGTIFLNVDNKADFSDKNSIVYGHRMKDGSMFRHLQDYEEKSFWEANPYFYIYTPDGREITYHIYAAAQVKDVSEAYRTVFETNEVFEQFIQTVKGGAYYDTGVEVKSEDSVVTLSTCTSASDDNRIIVCGVKEKEKNLKE